jgi:hypothetical protein
MYIFAGSWTMVHAILVFFVLPDSIATSGRWFNEREREILTQRIAKDQAGASDKRFHRDQLIEGLLDPKIWLSLVMGCERVSIANGCG